MAEKLRRGVGLVKRLPGLGQAGDEPSGGVVLGGGIRDSIVAGRRAGLVEKRHLVLKRWLAQRAYESGTRFFDVGTDHQYPFFDGYGPTQTAIKVLGSEASSARSYPSSYGTSGLRAAFAEFMANRFGVDVDPGEGVMISTGASQTFDALSRTMAGRFVVVPRLTLSTVTSIAESNGAQVIRLAEGPHGEPDLNSLRQVVERVGAHEVRFVYVNSPANPTGQVLDRGYLQRLVELAADLRILLVHDHDSWATVHAGDPSQSILQIPGAQDVAITVVSVSKELGLPGLRVGLVAGNHWAVNALRIHNSEFCVMVPEFCQAAAEAALRQYTEQSRSAGAPWVHVQEQIGRSLRAALTGWRDLGWPADALHPPQAGFKFLLAPPPAFLAVQEDKPSARRPSGDSPSSPGRLGSLQAGDDLGWLAQVSGVELFDFLAARDAGVKLSTSRSFNPDVGDWLRMIIMQPPNVMQDLFQALSEAGIHYCMPVPANLKHQYNDVIADLDLWNL